jgi:hypothetical protein
MLLEAVSWLTIIGWWYEFDILLNILTARRVLIWKIFYQNYQNRRNASKTHSRPALNAAFVISLWYFQNKLTSSCSRCSEIYKFNIEMGRENPKEIYVYIL